MKNKDERSRQQAVSEERQKKFRIGLTMKIVAMGVIPAIVIAVCMVFVGTNAIRSGLRDEMIDTLKQAVNGMSSMGDALGKGDYTLDANGNLMKNGVNITQNTQLIDSLVEDSELDVTFFYDKVRRATTLLDKKSGQRILGTEASDEVYEKVVENGENYTSYDIVINDEPYYAYYAPMKDSAGKTIGMYFAGIPTKSMTEFVKKQVTVLFVVAVVIAIIATVLVLFISIRISRGILATGRVITALANGDLQVEVEESALKRKDELGDIARIVSKLQVELKKVMSKVKESSNVLLTAGKDLSSMASQTSATADEIGHAVEDISKGAVSQAEDIETASARIEEMGNVIGRIVNGVAVLNTTSDNMKNAGDQSNTIIKELSQSNDRRCRQLDELANRLMLQMNLHRRLARQFN